MKLKRLSILSAVLALAVLVLGCPTNVDPAPEAEAERDLPGQGVMTKETALKIFEYTELEEGGVRIDKFINADALSAYLAGNARLAAAASDQPFRINRIGGKPVTRIGDRAFSPAAGAAAVGTVVLRIELPVTIVELGINLFDGVEVKITVDIPASAVEKLKENYIKKHNLDAEAAANLELGDILGEILAGSSVDIRPVEDPAAPSDPTAAAQLAADINAISAGIAAVNGATVTLSGKLLIERPFTVPEGVTLDVTADGAALALRDAALTVNGTVIAGPERVRLDDNASEGTINGNGTIQLKGKGRLLVVNRKLTLDGVTLVGVVDNDGPLVEVNDGGALAMKSGKITGNTHIHDNSSSGGGVAVRDGGTFIMQGGEISGNTAKSSGWTCGGGVLVRSSSTFIMEGGAISGNTAQSDAYDSGGGGVAVRDGGSTFTMTGGTISGNTAESNNVSHGGGLAVWADGVFTMQGGAISGNTAKGSVGSDGGGVVMWENGAFTMTGGTVSGNTAQSGGGVNFGGGTFTMKGSTISENTAGGGGGVTVGEGAIFTMTDSTISKNTANGEGGGVVMYGGAFIMKDSTIAGNTANSGGVIVHNGRFTMVSGAITGNTAGEWGGVRVLEGGTFAMESGEISGNSPNGVVVHDADSMFTLKGGTIYGSAGKLPVGVNPSLANGGSSVLASDDTAKWGTGGTYTKGGVSQTGGTDIIDQGRGSTDETLIAVPAK